MLSACKHGLLDVAKYIAINRNDDQDRLYIIYIRSALLGGHYQMLEWLYQTYKQDWDGVELDHQDLLPYLNKWESLQKTTSLFRPVWDAFIMVLSCFTLYHFIVFGKACIIFRSELHRTV
jgi:hypothetical protein